MSTNVLVVSHAGSRLSIFMKQNGINFTIDSFKNIKSFELINSLIDLIIIDFDEIPNSLDIILALNDYSPSRFIPIYGFMNTLDAQSNVLFFAFGGKEFLNIETLPVLVNNYKRNNEERNSLLVNEMLPNLSFRDMGKRIAENLVYIETEKEISEIPFLHESLPKSIESLMDQYIKLSKPDLVLILLDNNKEIESYVKPGPLIFENEYREFNNVCINDFYNHFKNMNLESVSEILFLGKRHDFKKISINVNKISSYLYLPFKDNSNKVIGTIHLGHLSNNYFSEKLNNKLIRLTERTGRLLNFILQREYSIKKELKLYNIFSRFVPEEIIKDLIINESTRENLNVEKKELTVLFSDIRSFTTITELNGAQEVVNFLNEHLELVVGIIKKHGGKIDKFIGDGIIALFGLDEALEDKSLQAVRAACEISRSMGSVDCSSLILPDNEYNIGIAVHEGPLIIGNLGSEDKSDYTAIGEIIGITENLESLTSNYEKRILISENVYHKVNGYFNMEKIDSVNLESNENMIIYSVDDREAYA